MNAPTGKLLSTFNEAGFQIQRLNYIWTLCNSLAPSGKLSAWNWQLDRAYMELSNDMWDDDGEEESEKENSYYQRIEQINSDIDKNWKKKTELYKCLQKKEQLLRRLQDDSGKGSRKSIVDEDLMD